MNPLQFSRALVILNGAVPLLMLAWDAYRGQLGANSVNNALHVTGTLSLVFLMLSLCMTPLRWVTGWGGWIAFRRALGLYGFFYSAVHVVLYVGFDRALNFSSTVHEIWTRRFLQVGTAAVLLMIPLAVTSTNAMLRWLGSQRWKVLHRSAYLVAILGVVHYYLLVKSDVRQPLAFAAVLAILLGTRFAHHYFELLKAAKKSVKGSPRLGATGAASPGVTPIVGGNAAPVGQSAGLKPRTQWKGELKVAAIFQETHDVKTFRLTSVEGNSLPFSYLPGQFLNLQLMIEGKRVNRSYTIASSPTRADACELSIKREPMGHASRFLHDQLNVGDILNVSGPAGKFVFTGKESPTVLLIAGGVGITPVMSILRYLTDRAWSGKIYFLIVAKTEKDLIFRDEIQWLKERFPQLHLCTTLTRAEPESLWTGDQGRATEALFRRFIPELANVPAYVCGPNEMMDHTRDLLLRMGVPDHQIKMEAFGSKKSKSPSSDDFAHEPSENGLKYDAPIDDLGSTDMTNPTRVISFARSMVRSEVNSETSVLEAAEASSIDLPYECRSGICGQCKTRLIEGMVAMDCEDALSSSEKASGWILACQAWPQSNVTVDV